MYKKLLLIAIYLCTLKFFQIRILDNYSIYACLYISIFILIFIFITKWSNVTKISISEFGGRYINVFLCYCFIPCLASIIFWNSGISSLFMSLYPFLSILIYFFLHIKKYKENEVISILFILAVSKTIITIIQQFTYPTIWFGSPLYNNEELIFDIRSGIIRYYLSLAFWLNVLLSFYFFSRFLKHYSNRNFLCLMITLIGIYIDQARTIMFLCGIVYLYIYIRNRNRLSKKSNLLFFFLLIFIICAYNIYFGELSDQTQNDLNSDYVRILSYKTFLFDFWVNPLAIIIGNGYPVPGIYANQLANYSEFTIFREDVGIIGTLNEYGIGLCIAVLGYLVKVYKNRFYISDYLVGYAIFSLGYIALYSPVQYDTQSNAFFGTFMFLVDLSYKKINRYG